MSRDELLAELRRKDAVAKSCPKDLSCCQELLDQRVNERTAFLEAAIREQESFSYSVSHDLRAPLRHINSFSTILIADHAKDLPAEAQEYLERICHASQKMGALIDHLLDLAKVAKAKINLQNVNLSKMAASTLRMFQETEPDHGAELVVEQGITAVGDRTLLRQLLQNLLGNAWKYTSKKKPARIHFGRANLSGKEAYFVKDNGAGFDMAYGQKMFNPFERLHGSEFEGLGIGLATVLKIVERHGGAIWAEGSVGEGATFYFTLPGGC
jgi:light-regulated signal transduction histidine kinase (bacteriophytochrome)